jgi:hypothetical protein
MMPLLLLLVLAIPVAIHIFNRSEGKVILFPSVALLPKQSTPTELQIKLYQKRLLLIRLLLFLLATLILISPLLADFLKQNDLVLSDSDKNPPPLIMVTQDWWAISNEQQKQSLFTDIKSDAAFADIQSVFLVSSEPIDRIRLINVDDFISNGSRYPWFTISNGLQSDAITLKPQNTWAIAQAIAADLSEKAAIHIYTSNRLSQFYGKAVSVGTANQVVHWNIAELANKVANFDSDKAEAEPIADGISVALLAQDTDVEAASLNNMIIAAIDALRLIAPIDLKIIEPNTYSPQAAASDFDKVLLYPNDTAQTLTQVYSSLPNAVDLSGLPNPKELSFVMALGEALLQEQEVQKKLRNGTLSQGQIENRQTISYTLPSYEQGIEQATKSKHPARPNTLSLLPESKANNWFIWLISLAVLLFSIERIYSEWIHRKIFNKPPANNSKAEVR